MPMSREGGGDDFSPSCCRIQCKFHTGGVIALVVLKPTSTCFLAAGEGTTVVLCFLQNLHNWSCVIIWLSFSSPYHVPTTSGTIPSELGNLESVKDLYLHINQLTGTIPIELMVGKLGRSVEWFEVSHNQLTGTIPDALTRLRRVKGFHVDTNLLTGTIPDSLRNMFSLGM